MEEVLRTVPIALVRHGTDYSVARGMQSCRRRRPYRRPHAGLRRLSIRYLIGSLGLVLLDLCH